MFQNFATDNVYIIGLLIIVFVFFLAGIRFMETRRIEKKFPKDRIVISSFGVNYFGLASEPGPPRRSTGALVLLKDGMYYRARYLKLELFIPGGALIKVDVVDAHKGKLLYQKMLGFTFVNETKKLDVAAFRMPHPSQWWTAVETLFLKNNPPKNGDSTAQASELSDGSSDETEGGGGI